MNQQQIIQHLDALAQTDSDIARAYAQLGAPAPRAREPGFKTLLNIIVSQLLSTESAAAIMGRLETLLTADGQHELDAGSLERHSDAELRAAGLSARKVEYARGLAAAVLDGSFNPGALHTMSNAEAITAITALRGFGRWSADIYLMLALGRTDIFPAEDLALLVALGKLKRMDTRPTAKEARQLLESWSPYRSAGSLFLWMYYRGAPV